MAKKSSKTKDLSPKKTGSVKGGKLATNHNFTLVRVANCS